MSNKQQSKSPAFQFYAQDWLADFNVRCLTYEQKGIYIELLAMSWIEPLTSDLDKLAMAMRLQKDSLAIIINQFFYKEGDFFYNKKLEKYRAEKIKFIKDKKRAGKAGADKRWSKTKTKPKHTYSRPNGTPIADPMANDSSLSLSLSSSSPLSSPSKTPTNPDGLEAIPPLPESITTTLKDRGVEFDITPASWKGFREDYPADKLEETVINAIHWIADKYAEKHKSVKDKVLRTGRLRTFLKDIPKIPKRFPYEPWVAYKIRCNPNATEYEKQIYDELVKDEKKRLNLQAND